MPAVVCSAQELDRMLARQLPLHVALSVRSLPDGTFAPAGIRYEFGHVLPLEDWPQSYSTKSEALWAGLGEAKRRMRGRWLWRHGERFAKN